MSYEEWDTYDFPDINQVLSRMKTVLKKPELIDLELPESIAYMKKDFYGFKPVKRRPWPEKYPPSQLNEKFEMPPLWNLRPNPEKYQTMNDLVAEIAELPEDEDFTWWVRSKFSRKAKVKKLPQVGFVDDTETKLPIMLCRWLRPSLVDRDLSVYNREQIDTTKDGEPFEYKQRKITKINSREFRIESKLAHLEWKMINPKADWYSWDVQGTLWERIKWADAPNGKRKIIDKMGGHSRYPEYHNGRYIYDDGNDPNWKRPLSLDMSITPSAVYGQAYLSLKDLNILDYLTVAIHFISTVEWSYGLIQKPSFIGDDEHEYNATPKPPLPKKITLVEAVKHIMRQGKSDLLTKKGKPRCSAMSGHVSRRVSAKERNTAWGKYKKTL